MKAILFISLMLVSGYAATVSAQTPVIQQSTSTANSAKNATVKKTSLRQRMKQEAKQTGSRATKRRQKMMADSLKRN